MLLLNVKNHNKGKAAEANWGKQSLDVSSLMIEIIIEVAMDKAGLEEKRPSSQQKVS
jgi:hypothetical protein